MEGSCPRRPSRFTGYENRCSRHPWCEKLPQLYVPPWSVRMQITQQNVTPNTPMGAQLVSTGATFRAWAPRASAVYVNGRFGSRDLWTKRDPNLLLTQDAHGYWAGFLDGVSDGDQYLFYVVGRGGENSKRDPYARE